MTIGSTGQISLGGSNVGISIGMETGWSGFTGTQKVSMNDTSVRALSGKSISALNRFTPTCIAVNTTQSVLYFADPINNVIRQMPFNGFVATGASVSVLAGGGTGGNYPGYQDGVGTSTLFNQPTGLAVDPNTGNIYVADTFNHVIRKITPSGAVTTYAGQLGIFGETNSTALNLATFTNPVAITIDGSSNIYVLEMTHAIRKISANGVTTLVSANPLNNFATPHTNQGMILNGFVVDSAGTLYVSRANSNEIVKILPDGTQSIFYRGDTSARYMGLAISPTGYIYAADWGNGYVMTFNQLGTPIVNTSNFYSSINGYSQRQSPQAVAIGFNNVEFDLVNYNRYDPTVYVDNNARIFYGSSFESLYTIDLGFTGEISFSDFYNKQGRSYCQIQVANTMTTYQQSLPTGYSYTSAQTTYGYWVYHYYGTNYQIFDLGYHAFGYLNHVNPSPINGVSKPAYASKVMLGPITIYWLGMIDPHGGWGTLTNSYLGAVPSFMNSCAIWDPNSWLSVSFSRTVPVYFPNTGTYGFTASYDNSGSVALDGNVISALSASYPWYDTTNNNNNYVNAAVTVTAGWHNISLTGTNTGGVGGIALQIRKGNPGWNSGDVTTYPIIFSTQNFNGYIDTLYPENGYTTSTNLGNMVSGNEFGYTVTELSAYMDSHAESYSPYGTYSYFINAYTNYSRLRITYPTDPSIPVYNTATGISVSSTSTNGWINSVNGWNKLSVSAKSYYTPSLNHNNDSQGAVFYSRPVGYAYGSTDNFKFYNYNSSTYTALWVCDGRNIFDSAEIYAGATPYTSYWNSTSPAMADGSTFYITFFRYSDSTGYNP